MVVSTTSASQDSTVATDDAVRTDDRLSWGDAEFIQPPSMITSGQNQASSFGLAIEARGTADRGGDFVSGEAYLEIAGERVATESLTGLRFSLVGTPPGVASGETYGGRPADQKIVVLTEDGGIVTNTFSGTAGTLFASFAGLSVTVLDADGNPLSAQRVGLDGDVTLITGDDGSAVVSTSGDVTVTSLGGSLSKTATAGQADPVTFQYAGIDGGVKTPDGDAISGKKVGLVDQNGNVLAVEETDDTGSYSFTQVPVETSLYVTVDPYFRAAASRSEGQFAAKNFPANSMRAGDPFGDSREVGELGSISVEGIDAVEDRPASGVQTFVGEFDVTTNAQGVAKAFVEVGGSVEVAIGANRRYRTRRFDVDTENPSVGEIELERQVRSTQT